MAKAGLRNLVQQNSTYSDKQSKPEWDKMQSQLICHFLQLIARKKCCILTFCDKTVLMNAKDVRPVSRWMPKFTFSHFTRDPNLHNPHLHKTQIYTTPNFHRTQIYMPPDLHHLKFTKPRFTQTQIYTASNIHKTQISTIPILHRPQFYNTKICI